MSESPPVECRFCFWWSSYPGEADGHCYLTETSSPATYSCPEWTDTHPDNKK